MTPQEQEQIMKDMKSGMTLMDASAKHGYNISAISRLFKRQTGQSLRSYKKAQR
jgi:hypothetical protein